MRSSVRSSGRTGRSFCQTWGKRMADTVTPEMRSRNMAAIRSKDTEPEVYLRKLLFAEGLRYRKNDSRICGHPDLYFPKYRAVVFIHGCFWHRHPGCRYSYHPKSRQDYWEKKFLRNIQRDAEVKESLASDSIRQLIVWECTVKGMKKDPARRDEVLKEILAFLQSDKKYMEI